MPVCRNWQTTATQNRVEKSVWVRVPPPAPEFSALSFTVQGFLLPNGLYSSVLRVERQDRIRRRNLAAVIQMGVDVGSCPNIAVPQPLLDFLQADAICVKQAGAAVPLRYNYDKPENPRRIKGFEVFSLVFSSFSKPKNHTERRRIIGGVL